MTEKSGIRRVRMRRGGDTNFKMEDQTRNAGVFDAGLVDALTRWRQYTALKGANSDVAW